MLTPEQMGDAGETVAEVYRQIEAELIEWLAQKMYEKDLSGQRFRTALGLLSQKDIAEATRIIEAHAQEVDEAVLAEVKSLLAASDAFDLAAIARGIGATIASEALTVQTLLVVASVREAMARDNLEMAAAARTKFLQWSTWAATQVSTGNMTADKALRKAVRELARGGLSIELVTYRDPETGKVTVTNKVDVAVARHVRSLIGQGAAQLTFERMRENDVEFVEVSSHTGARPSHAKWHGRCYHVGGDVTVDGVLYPDFFEGTGYRGERGPYTALGDQLLGVNCRHSFAPWVPGSPRAYEADPKHPSGLSNDEIYNLTQGQRARERKIREAKRELSAAQIAYDANPTLENAAELTRAKQLLRNRQEGMREYIKEANAKGKPGTEVLKRLPNREWAGDMPKIKQLASSGRKLDDFLSGSDITAQLKTHGITKSAARKALADEMVQLGGKTSDFSILSAKEQRGIFKKIISAMRKPADISDAKHADTLAGVVRGKPMTFKEANGGKVNPNINKGAKWWLNCQSCVVAFEARMRGYNVIARPYAKHGTARDVAENGNIAWFDPATGARPLPTIAHGANTSKRVLKFLEDNVKPEARYTLQFATDIVSGDGHIVTIMRNNVGDLRIYDPQNGVTYEDREMRNYIKTFKLQGKSMGLTIERPIELLRIDNLDINKLIVEQIVEEAQ